MCMLPLSRSISFDAGERLPFQLRSDAESGQRQPEHTSLDRGDVHVR